MNTVVVHFTLGPVQGFVAQARRTRDLWAGSFLLSWLSGKAMSAVLDGGGEIVFPVVHNGPTVTDPLLKAIREHGHGCPQIGTVPNRFKARVPSKFDPKVCRDAIAKAWTDLANEVFAQFIAIPANKEGRNHEVKTRWELQIKSFWDIAWVMGPEGDDGLWLDMRKNWRTHLPPPDASAGDRCTMMGDWQEISGYVRARDSARQDSFWRTMRRQKGVGPLNLRDGERLCAIALVKRLFPRLPESNLKNTIGWVPGGDPRRVGNWPSTAHMAAVHWIEKAWQATDKACAAYVETVGGLVDKNLLDAGIFGETATRIACLDGIGRFAQLDGYYFFKPELENPRATVFKDEPEGDAPALDDKSARQRAVEALEGLGKAVNIEPATPFYAILLMDGDRLGALLRDKGPEKVSTGLARFAQNISAKVEQNNGVLIYAGGDDVLALLPLEDAISAAMALRETYRNAFDQDEAITISAAIVFAHYHLPLRAMLHEAHHQLEDVAKERNGRDSLAVAVFQGAGKTIEWVAKWDLADKTSPAQSLLDLVKAFRDDRQFSSRFFYKIRERFEVLTDDDHKLIPGLDPQRLLVAEYLKTRGEKTERSEAELRVNKLHSVCQVNDGTAGGSSTLKVDGALLVRFLANQGVEP